MSVSKFHDALIEEINKLRPVYDAAVRARDEIARRGWLYARDPASQDPLFRLVDAVDAVRPPLHPFASDYPAGANGLPAGEHPDSPLIT